MIASIAAALVLAPQVETWDGKARQLVQGARSDRQKVEKIHDWVVSSIQYDAANNSAAQELQTAKSCFLARRGGKKAVADLYNSMLLIAGVNSQMIQGTIRSLTFQGGQPVQRHLTHYWSRVSLNGTVYWSDPVSSLWNSGARYGSGVMLADPQSLRYTHRADGPSRTGEPNLSQTSAELGPLVQHWIAREYGAEPPMVPPVMTINKYGMITIPIKEPCIVSPELYYQGNRELSLKDEVLVIQTATAARIYLSPRRIGMHQLSIYLGHPTKKLGYKLMVTYPIAVSALANRIDFPSEFYYTDMVNAGINMIDGFQGVVNEGETLPITLSTKPGEQFVMWPKESAQVMSSEMVPLTERRPGYHVLMTKLKPGNWYLGRKTGENSYKKMASYTVTKK